MTEPCGTECPEWELSQAFEYSRHYDNLLWIVTSLLTTANMALLAIVNGSGTIQVGLAGVALSDLTVFFATSFRLLRRRVHAFLEQGGSQAKWLYSGLAGFGAQWLVFVCFYGGLATLWIWHLQANFADWSGLWWILHAVSLVLLVWLYLKGRRGSGEPANEPGRPQPAPIADH